MLGRWSGRAGSESASTRVNPPIMSRVFSGLWDVDEDASEKLHRVEKLWVDSVVPGFYLVENLLSVGLVTESLKADGCA